MGRGSEALPCQIAWTGLSSGGTKTAAQRSTTRSSPLRSPHHPHRHHGSLRIHQYHGLRLELDPLPTLKEIVQSFKIKILAGKSLKSSRRSQSSSSGSSSRSKSRRFNATLRTTSICHCQWQIQRSNQSIRAPACWPSTTTLNFLHKALSWSPLHQSGQRSRRQVVLTVQAQSMCTSMRRQMQPQATPSVCFLCPSSKASTAAQNMVFL